MARSAGAEPAAEAGTCACAGAGAQKGGRGAAAAEAEGEDAALVGSAGRARASRPGVAEEIAALRVMRKEFPMLDGRGLLPARSKLLYVFPHIGIHAATYMKNCYMKVFYVDGYPRASMSLFSLFSVLGVLVSAFSDPLVANFSDTWRPSFLGRRRPFVLLAAALLALVLTAAWLPPVPAGGAASVWFGATHIATQLSASIYFIPMQAWGAELSPDAGQRSNTFMWQSLAAHLGILLGVVTPGVFSHLGGVSCTGGGAQGCIGFPALSCVFVALMAMGCGLQACCGRERACSMLPPASRKVWSEDGIIPTSLTIFMNRPFRVLLVALAVDSIGSSLPIVVLPLVTRGVLGDACMNPDACFAMLAGVSMVARSVSLPIWFQLAKRRGKVQTYVFGAFAGAASQSLFLLLRRDSKSCGVTILMVGVVAVWGACGSVGFLLNAIISDIADYDQLLTGKRREGQYIMGTKFLPRLIEIPADTLPFLLLAALGYRRATDGSSLPEQPTSVVWLLRLCSSVLPAGCLLWGAFLLLQYPEAAKNHGAHKRLLHALADHRDGSATVDPWFPDEGRLPPPPAPGAAGPTDGVLAHLWFEELLEVVGESGTSTTVSCAAVRRRIALSRLLPATLLLPVGAALLSTAELATEPGAAQGTFGVMVLGVALVLVWFHGTRLRAAREVERRCVPRAEVEARVRFLSRFTGVQASSMAAKGKAVLLGAAAEGEAAGLERAESSEHVEVTGRV